MEKSKLIISVEALQIDEVGMEPVKLLLLMLKLMRFDARRRNRGSKEPLNLLLDRSKVRMDWGIDRVEGRGPDRRLWERFKCLRNGRFARNEVFKEPERRFSGSHRCVTRALVGVQVMPCHRQQLVDSDQLRADGGGEEMDR